MAGVPLTRSADLREKLLDALPEHDWSIAKAGVAVGYSPRYANTTLATIIKKDAEFCKRINERRQAMMATRGDKVDKLIAFLERTVDSDKAALRDKLKAADSLAKIHGIYSETRVIETSQRQQQLTQAEQDEAKRLLSLRLDTTGGYGIPGTGVPKSLPAGDIARDSDIIDAQAEPNDGQSSAKAGPNDDDDLAGAAVLTPYDGPPSSGSVGALPPNDGVGQCSPVPPEKFPGGAKPTLEVHNPIPEGRE